MKKAIVYSATAVLLGMLVMILPLRLYIDFAPPQYAQEAAPYPPESEYLSRKGITGDLEQGQALPWVLVSQPASWVFSSLILLFGLIVALGVFAYSKRRIQ